MNLTVSIIIPSLNCGVYIKETLESLKQQTWPFYEIILIDSGSQDNTLEIVKQMSIDGLPIRVLISNKKEGPAKARALGIENSRGDYIAFLDADDIWHPEKLKQQMKLMLDLKLGFTYTQIKTIDENGQVISKNRTMQASYTFESLLRSRGICTSSVIIHKSLLTNDILSLDSLAAEDLLWWLSILKKGAVAVLCPLSLVCYRIRSNSMSSNMLRNQKCIYDIYSKRLGLSKLKGNLLYLIYLGHVTKRYSKEILHNYFRGTT